MIVKNFTRVIGLMSGTSLDGLDICCVDFGNEEKQYSFQNLVGETINYSENIKSELKNAFNLGLNGLDKINLSYGQYLGSQVNEFIKKNNLEGTIDLIASHGHTIFHQPEKKITVQIGDGNEIQRITHIPTISNFRITDVLLGGQGAPLVPVGDHFLFSEFEACLNLGGFSNISFVQNGNRIAFDISPCNLPLNLLMEKYFHMPYDNNGELSGSGQINLDLLNELNNLTYYSKTPPKSLGYEWLINDFLRVIEKYDVKPIDLLRTITEHIAIQINSCIKSFNLKSVLISGGGVRNDFLISLIKQSNVQITIPPDEIVNFKEALIFAFLGYLNLNNSINTFKSVTGATSDSIGGIRHFGHQQ